MTIIYDIEPEKLVEKAAEELKKIDSIKMPDWAKFVKTSSGKARPPIKLDWWYVRVASILRKLYLRSPLGVERLKGMYGCKKDRGHRPDERRRGSGKIIRVILQQLEQAEFVKKVEEKKGREITAKGKKFLDGLFKNVKS